MPPEAVDFQAAICYDKSAKEPYLDDVRTLYIKEEKK